MSALDPVQAVRALLAEGVRVHREPDGSLSLGPADRVTPAAIALATAAKPAIAALVADLPAPDRCQICGEATGAGGKSLVNCTTCALIVAKRMGLTKGEAR